MQVSSKDFWEAKIVTELEQIALKHLLKMSLVKIIGNEEKGQCRMNFQNFVDKADL